MIRWPLPVLLAAVALAACGTPQEQCISRETRDLRTVEALITQTRANIDRGYALEETTVTVQDWDWCVVPGPERKGKPTYIRRMCLEDRTETRTKPVAIDLRAEGAKLESLLAKRDELAIEAVDATAQCRALYPEG